MQDRTGVLAIAAMARTPVFFVQLPPQASKAQGKRRGPRVHPCGLDERCRQTMKGRARHDSSLPPAHCCIRDEEFAFGSEPHPHVTAKELATPWRPQRILAISRTARSTRT